jgi:16S rRNA (guanine527-N7)-methyltransferase
MNEKVMDLLVTGASELGIRLGATELGKLDRFAEELKKWNKRINITAIRDDEGIAVKHFLDSLTVLKVIGASGRLLDIGSGGGFPAIPLKIACSALEVISVDSVEKKIIFQRHAARILGLHGFQALHARAEDLASRYAGHFDWIVSRAFADIISFVGIALPLAGENGKLIAMKGKGGRKETISSGTILRDMGGEIKDIVEFKLPDSGDERSLVIIGRI